MRQSLKIQDKREARRRLRELEAQMGTGERQTTPKETWDTAAAELLAYYQAYGIRKVTEVGYKIKVITSSCTGWKPADLDAAAVLGYVAHRRYHIVSPSDLQEAARRLATRTTNSYNSGTV